MITSDKKFASQANLQAKTVSFDKLSDNAYAYTAEGDPNTGIIIGDDSVLVADTQATPVMAQDVIRRIREVTDKPIKYVLLTHYHAVRVLGASGYKPEHIVASQDTYDLIVERGEADMKSEIARFPRLFQSVESIPGLTWPTIAFKGEMTLWLGKLEVKIMQLVSSLLRFRHSSSRFTKWSSKVLDINHHDDFKENCIWSDARRRTVVTWSILLRQFGAIPFVFV